MCGRYQLDVDENTAKEIRTIVDSIQRKGQSFKTGEIFPTNSAPIIYNQGNNQDYSAMKWGFPRFNSKGVVINARSETAAEKSMFSRSLREKRCIIPTTGFYEWQKVDSSKVKDKFLFKSDEGKVLYLAGLYNAYRGEESFVILTRDANLSIADIHDRMPVVLKSNELDNWLHDDNFVDFVLNRDNIMLQRQQV